jgi:hypothetical protein
MVGQAQPEAQAGVAPIIQQGMEGAQPGAPEGIMQSGGGINTIAPPDAAAPVGPSEVQTAGFRSALDRSLAEAGVELPEGEEFLPADVDRDTTETAAAEEPKEEEDKKGPVTREDRLGAAQEALAADEKKKSKKKKKESETA